jgi:hypothetical protein
MKRSLALSLLFLLTACSNEEPDWLATVEQNSIDGYVAFLAEYPNGARAAEATEFLRELYRARATEATPMVEAIPLREEGAPRILRNAQEEDIARRSLESGVWITTDARSGEVLYSTPADADGNRTDPLFLCLTEDGEILFEEGEPALVEPFTSEILIPRGAVTSRDEYDPYGRPNIRYDTKFGSINAAEVTGHSGCVFVW